MLGEKSELWLKDFIHWSWIFLVHWSYSSVIFMNIQMRDFINIKVVNTVFKMEQYSQLDL